MIIVTGGAGFIGSNIVHALNARGITDILVVDDLTDGHKCLNLVGADFRDYLDKDSFLERIANGRDFGAVRAVFHEGACSTTTEWNGRFVMQVNYDYSKALLHWCLHRGVPFLYASSASVYGMGPGFSERREHEHPLNMYAFSKWQFDQYVRALPEPPASQVVGLRYFNVYGPREQHKGPMASVAYHFHHQLLRDGKVRLFGASDGYGPGEQRRDFIHVDDLVRAKLWIFDHPEVRGIFNLGTGHAQSFNEVARAVIGFHGRGEIEYIPFPDHLKGAYQSYTQADMSRLRSAGYDAAFMRVEEGVPRYLQWLQRP
ncbi:ADP-glyceromanno-heptose 6-epimerase precursor [Tibeticola sediminis]|jgi:ADP-L-glycero-D-manno-heptose 6-epimerase|uniref:ADP-L-glycero-D-manno-heptose-6-epimerase n=1 Tax=Tibeticola sediminis TaxID=1917811 RepID=A0A3N4VFA6_9BURK|nr:MULTISPECIES: ADP-glyceromanno-heptose 6-epimerase [Tibeticola]MCI4441389.1 ADP-glyceromanno-heptose 6-epimerase [Tibeticola sp.]RPE72560.1 ADP-glyceromanno-heptose 6-epimerase precursor [Tibeticola sediminis]